MELEQIQIRATLGFSDAQLALGYMYYEPSNLIPLCATCNTSMGHV